MGDNRNAERQRERDAEKGRRRRDFWVEAVAEVSKKVCNLRGVIGLWGRKGGDRCRRASLVHFMDTRYGMMSSPPVASHVGGGEWLNSSHFSPLMRKNDSLIKLCTSSAVSAEVMSDV